MTSYLFRPSILPRPTRTCAVRSRRRKAAGNFPRCFLLVSHRQLFFCMRYNKEYFRLNDILSKTYVNRNVFRKRIRSIKPHPDQGRRGLGCDFSYRQDGAALGLYSCYYSRWNDVYGTKAHFGTAFGTYVARWTYVSLYPRSGVFSYNQD